MCLHLHFVPPVPARREHAGRGDRIPDAGVVLPLENAVGVSVHVKPRQRHGAFLVVFDRDRAVRQRDVRQLGNALARRRLLGRLPTQRPFQQDRDLRQIPVPVGVLDHLYVRLVDRDGVHRDRVADRQPDQRVVLDRQRLNVKKILLRQRQPQRHVGQRAVPQQVGRQRRRRDAQAEFFFDLRRDDFLRQARPEHELDHDQHQHDQHQQADEDAERPAFHGSFESLGSVRYLLLSGEGSTWNAQRSTNNARRPLPCPLHSNL